MIIKVDKSGKYSSVPNAINRFQRVHHIIEVKLILLMISSVVVNADYSLRKLLLPNTPELSELS